MKIPAIIFADDGWQRRRSDRLTGLLFGLETFINGRFRSSKFLLLHS